MSLATTNDFKTFVDLKFDKVMVDFNNEVNLDKIWEICKYFLLISGFKKNVKNNNLPEVNNEKINYLKH